MNIKTKRKARKPDRPSFLSKAVAKHTRPAGYRFPLRTLTIAAPLQITEDGVLAWFIQGPLNWEFMIRAERMSEHDGQTSRWGQLAEQFETVNGRPFHWRRTTVPYGAKEQAARLDAEADPINIDAWNEYLRHDQNRLRSTGLDQKMTAVGLWIADVPSDEAIADLSDPDGWEHPRKEAADILNRYAETASVVTGDGMEGIPATPEDISLLMHRSLSMGLPAPTYPGLERAVWDRDGLGEFQDRSTWIAAPFGDHVHIVGDVEGVHSERYVAVLSSGIMPEKVWPESGEDGWLMAMDRLGFPVEASVKGVLKTGAQVEAEAVFNLRRTKATDNDYRVDHRMEPPEAVARAIQSAKITHDEVTAGNTRTAPRAVCTVRWAVHGTTKEEADERARKVVVFAKDKLRFPLTRTVDQARELRGFVPGEPDVPNGFERRPTVAYLSAAMPRIGDQVGTPHGFYIGYTALSRRAVLFDPHWAPENDLPGLFPIVGQPGSGKSQFTGQLAHSLVLSGRRTIVQDFSGPLAKMVHLPELKGHAAELNLMRADEGTLSPPLLIPTPVRDNFRDDDGEVDEIEYQRAVKTARADRMELSTDSLRMLLSPALSRVLGVEQRLGDAVESMQHHKAASKSGVTPTMWNLRWALQYLERRNDELGHQIWRELEAASRFPGGQLIIPSHSDPIEDAGLGDKMLTVVTMPGMASPPADTPREDWSLSERYAQAPMHLCSFLTAKGVYDRPKDERKALLGDEAQQLLQQASGRNLFARTSADSRKVNLFSTFASQSPLDIQMLGPRWSSLIGGAFVFRLGKMEAALQACELIDAAPEYADSIRTSRPGQCVFLDPLGRKAKMQVDADWHPSHRVFNTTPKRDRREWSMVPPPAPTVDPRLFGGDDPAEPVTVPLPVVDYERNVV